MKDFLKTTRRFFPAVLVLGLVGLFWQANAQNYQYIPMPTTDATWNVFYHPRATIMFNNIYSTAGDTLINNETWNKIVSSNNGSDEIYQGSYLEENKIVRFCSPDGKIDTLYDFNLEVGDTVKFIRLKNIIPDLEEHWAEDTVLIVEQINMIEVNGSLRKHFVFKAINTPIFEYLKEEWIEGIGSIHGVLFPLNARPLVVEASEKEDLTCFWIEDNLLWKNNSYNSCEVLKTNEYSMDDKIKICPNPVQNQITIFSAEYIIKDIVFFDFMGKCVLLKNDCHSFQENINIQFLQDGIYTIQVISSTGKTITKKIVKQ